MGESALHDLQRAVAAALLAPATGAPRQLAGDQVSREVRLSVHRSNVLGSLRRNLEGIYPVARALVGEQCFGALAGRFVRERPPCDGCLSEYGAEFPAFVEASELSAEVPYLSDVARLEWLRSRAWRSPADEPLGVDELRTLLQRDPSRVRLRLNASARLLQSPHPVLDIWRAHQQDAPPAPESVVASKTARILVTRPQLAVELHALSPAAYAFATTVAAERTLAEAFAAADAAQRGFDGGATLATLVRACAFSRAIETVG